MPTKVKLK